MAETDTTSSMVQGFGGGTTQGGSTGAAAGPWGALIGAAIGGTVGLVGGFFSAKSAKKQQAAADAKTNQAVALMQEQDARLAAFLKDVEETDRKQIEQVAQTYTQIDAIQQQALADGKADLAEQYGVMKDLVDTNLRANLAAVGKNYDEMKGQLDAFAKTARGYVESDIEVQDQLRKQFDTDTSKVIPAMQRAMDATSARVQEIQARGGLTPEADAVLSKTAEGLKQAKVQFEQHEALGGGAGRTSRRAGFDIEAVKAMAEVNANLRSSGTQELNALRGQQTQQAGQLQAAGATKQAAMQDTSGAQRLGLEGSLLQSNQALTGQRQSSELGLKTEASGKQEQLLGQRQATDLGLEQSYYKDRASMIQNQGQNISALTQQGVSNREAVLGQQVKVASSIADVLRGASANLTSMATTSMGNAASGFSMAGKMGSEALSQWGKTSTVPNPKGAGQKPVPQGIDDNSSWTKALE